LNDLGSIRRIFYSAAVLLIVAYGLSDSRIRNALTGGWERKGMAEIAQTWVKPLGLAAVTLLITGWLAVRSQSRITVNWLFVAGCGVWLWLCAPVPSSATIVQRQIELQKLVGVPALNDRIYETLNTLGLDGKIATDYWFLQRLPILKNYMFGYGFPTSVSAADLARAAGQRGVCYVLIQNERLDASAKDALAQHLYHTVAAEDGYRFIETCRGKYAEEDNAAAALTAELELPSREKNGLVGCGVLAFGPDGHDDLVFKLDLAVKPDSPLLNAEITYLELQRSNLPGVLHTSNSHFLLGVAQIPGGPLLNFPNGTVKLPIQKRHQFWLYACDDGANRPGTYYARVRIGRDSWVESKSVTLRSSRND
jgi:hypothetical protein